MFMGGVLMISTIDDKQLQPIDGFPVLLSPHILTTFMVRLLTHSVRAAKCRTLRRIIEIMRHSHEHIREHPLVVREFCQLLEHCTFVPSWDHPAITKDVFRAFARTIPAEEAKAHFRDSVKKELSHDRTPWVSRVAEDIETPVESHRDWQPASQRASKRLSKEVKEPCELVFFVGGIYQFTHNDRENRFTQSRLAHLTRLPTRHQLQNFEKMHIWVAPPGCKTPPADSATEDELRAAGWKEVLTGEATMHHHTFTNLGVKAARRQCGVNHYVSSTIHAAQGATLRKLATMVQDDDMHRSWSEAQLMVLLSRTTTVQDLTFVGDKGETIRMLKRALFLRSQFAEHMEHVLKTLAGVESSEPVVRLDNPRMSPHRPCDMPLPSNLTGSSCFLVSTQDWTTTHIGETIDLRQRMTNHNAGEGAKQTQPCHLRPWALMGCVTGFQGDKKEMKDFEARWQCLSRFRVSHGQNGRSLQATLDAGKDSVKHCNDPTNRFHCNLHLVFIQHATVD